MKVGDSVRVDKPGPWSAVDTRYNGITGKVFNVAETFVDIIPDGRSDVLWFFKDELTVTAEAGDASR